MSVIVFGASGYTGRLVVAALVRRGLRPILAGRDEVRLLELAAAHGGLPSRVADAARPESVRALLSPGDVILTCVGPFARHGRVALEAALHRGAHYLDCCGEPGFVARVYREYSRPAEAAGVVVLTAFGHDFVPGHVAAGVALRAAGAAADRVAVGYFLTGDAGCPSSGSAATLLSSGAAPGIGFRDGRRIEQAVGQEVVHFDLAGRRQPAFSLPSTEPLFLPRSYPQLRRVDAYLGWFGAATYAVPAWGLAGQWGRLWGVQPAMERLLAAAGVSGRGPGAARRARSGAHVVAIAYRNDEPLARADLEGVNVYDHTAGLLAWGAEHIEGVTARGVLGPLEAFALAELVEANRQAGFALL